MSDAETLRALAERVERLTGPDREVDAKVAQATGRIPVSAAYEGTLKIGDMAWSNGLGFDVPPFTASLDAAISLLPEGCKWKADSHYNIARVYEYLLDPDSGPYCRGYVGEGYNLASGLTAAALRARAAS